VNVAHVDADIQRDVERRFPPEFLNRIDEVVMFSSLTQDEAREIARRYLADIARVMAKSGKQLNVDDEALELMTIEGYSPQLGARFLKRAIDQHVKVPITRQWHTSSRFCMSARNGRVTCVSEDSAARAHLSAPAARRKSVP
jgi:ATP-dependent Clp protease ATP-binding subunit ClpA